MVKIDRENREKVIKIGTRRIRYGTICVLGLLIILVFSSVGAYITYLGSPEDELQEQDSKIQVGLVVVFDRNNTVSKPVRIEPNVNALFAFKEIAEIETEDTSAGKRPFSVAAGNKTLAKNETHEWLFFVNGRIYFRGLEQYTVQNGDVLELQYSRNFE